MGKGTFFLKNDDNSVEIFSDDWILDIVKGKGTITSKNKVFNYSGGIETFFQIRRPYCLVFFPHGRGVLLNNNGIETYVGHFKQGTKEGRGIEYYDNGTRKYSGDFLEDRYHGEGKLYGQNGVIEYNGDFSFGLKHGYGLIYHNGSLELSRFKFGNKFGKSTITDSNHLKSDVNYYYGNNIVSKKLKLKDSNLQDEKCPICQCNYKNNDLITDLPNCGHTFHSECLFKWLDTNETCPMCRSDNLFVETCSNKRKFDEIVGEVEMFAI